MTKCLEFKIFCLERYKHIHNLSGKEAFNLFKKHGVLDYLNEFYDVLHTFGDRYIVEDIDKYISARNV
ncbi:MAG: DUF3791 domain-containing protein [Oscillospiraceae bacterium]|nr:DUF3791 domain-containing protein [Oscillospiraceae bacterium]